MSSPVVQTEALNRIFVRGDEEIRALDSISLTIEPGEFVAITGSSGSGKSTLMYILSDNQRAQLRNQFMGFVFQGFHLLPKATALRNVAMPLVYSASYDRGFSLGAANERARAALERVGMADRMTHRPNELSGGQRQRVAIARALVNSPQVLFADEPTGNLDSKRGQEIFTLFKELNSDGVTIVLVTHDGQLAAQATRQIVMLDGRISSDTGGVNATS